MKKIFKKVLVYIEAIIACALFACIFYASYSYLNKAFEDNSVDHGHSFHSLPENSMDILVLGSSHAQYSFIPSYFYEDSGLYSYVLGSACQPLEVSYEMLKEALKTQKPELVVLEVYTALPLRSACEADSCYVIAGSQMSGQEKINTFNYLDDEKAESYYNSFINTHNEWKNINDLNKFKPSYINKKRNSIDYSFGYVFAEGEQFYPENWWHANVYNTKGEFEELDELDLLSLNNIYDLCNENRIELLLYKTPVDSMTEKDFLYLNAVWKWAEERNVNYVDFFREQYNLNFYMWIHSDSFHCYVEGAGLITDYLSNVIKDMNIDFSHQDDTNLNSKYHMSSDVYTRYYLRNEHDPYVYQSRLKNATGYLLVKYNPTRKSKFNALSYLNQISEDIDTLNGNYYALLLDGKIIYSSNDPFEYEYNGHVFKIDNTHAGFDDYLVEIVKGDLSFAYIDNEISYVITKDINAKTCFDCDYVNYHK